jgi:hypothetical protein
MLYYLLTISCFVTVQKTTNAKTFRWRWRWRWRRLILFFPISIEGARRRGFKVDFNLMIEVYSAGRVVSGGFLEYGYEQVFIMVFHTLSLVSCRFCSFLGRDNKLHFMSSGNLITTLPISLCRS